MTDGAARAARGPERGARPDTLLVTFASLTNPGKPAPSAALFNTVQRLLTGPNPVKAFDTLYMLPNGNDWYMSGVRGLPDGLLRSAQQIKSMLADYSRVIFIGNSMGGYAALHFGVLCGAHRIIAFAPQVRIDREFHETIREKRWAESFFELYQNWGDKLRAHGLDIVLGSSPALPRIDIYVGQESRQDIANAQILMKFDVVSVHVIGEIGHDVAHHLKANGELDTLLRAELN